MLIGNTVSFTKAEVSEGQEAQGGCIWSQLGSYGFRFVIGPLLSHVSFYHENPQFSFPSGTGPFLKEN